MSVSEAEISQVMDEMFAEAKGVGPVEEVEVGGDSELKRNVRDLYDEHRKKDSDYLSKKYPKGSSQLVAYATDTVISKPPYEGATPLEVEYTIVKNEIRQLVKNRRNDRAEARRRQYMEDRIWPAIAVVVNASSPDELLNSEYALKQLDKYSIPTIALNSGDGYAEKYIRIKYADHLGGQSPAVSDPTVRGYIRNINRYLDDGQIVMALGLASKAKDSIDKGSNLASDTDYELLNRIVSYYGGK